MNPEKLFEMPGLEEQVRRFCAMVEESEDRATTATALAVALGSLLNTVSTPLAQDLAKDLGKFAGGMFSAWKNRLHAPTVH